MLRGTATALTRSTDGTGVLVVGGLLTLLTWVVIPIWIGGSLLFPPLVLLAPLALAPAFVARGYFVRVLAAGIATGNADGAPPVVAWNDLYRDGLKSALVSAVLLAPLGLGVALVALAGGVLGTETVDPAPVADAVRASLGERGVTAVVGVAGGLVGAVSAAYLLAVSYVRPAALAAFAASGRFRDGLRPRRVARIAGSGRYATAWGVAAATLGAGYALAGPVVPLVVGAAVVFVVRVVAYGLYGRGAAATLEVADRGDEDGATDPTAAEATEESFNFACPPTPEVPTAVQTGRTVPLDGTSVRGTRGCGAVGADGGFDWHAPDEKSVDCGGDSGSDADRTHNAVGGDGATGATDGDNVGDAVDAGDAAGDEFEWAVDVAGPEDKS